MGVVFIKSQVYIHTQRAQVVAASGMTQLRRMQTHCFIKNEDKENLK